MLKRVVFLGSKSAGLHLLERLSALAPDNLVGAITFDDRTDPRSAFHDIVRITDEKRIPLSIVKHRSDSETRLAALRPDLVFVLGWYWLLTKATLERIPGGVVGIHFSLLPKYRGTSPVVWQIINGEEKVGLSVFSMSEGFDEGPLWAQTSVPLGETDYVSDVLGRLEAETLRVISDLYPRILAGTNRPQPQDTGPATYCAARLPQDGEINWSHPARSVYNFIRAQSAPYPGAFTRLGDQELPVWKAAVLPDTYYGTPGQVAAVSSSGVCVVCGDSRALMLQTVGDNAPAETVIKSVKTRLPQFPLPRVAVSSHE